MPMATATASCSSSLPLELVTISLVVAITVAEAVEKLDGYDKIEDKAWVVCRAQKKAEREAELKAKFDAYAHGKKK